MHDHRLCLPPTARMDTTGRVEYTKGRKPDALPHGMNSKWRASHTYHTKKNRPQLREGI